LTMKIVKCKTTSTVKPVVICIECGHRVKLDNAYADLHGEPYKAYYCDGCNPAVLKDEVTT